MPAHTVDVTESNFQTAVIEESRKRPVLVDFWAPWCAPCRALTPILEKLAIEYDGKFLLARLNSDENQLLASDFGVRGIPNVKAFVNGEPADEFTGAIPEGTVRLFIDRLLPSPAEMQRDRAMQLFAACGISESLQLLQAAQDLEPANDKIRIDRADVLIALERADDAIAVLDELGPLAESDPRAKRLRAQATFSNARSTVDPAAAEKRLASDPADLESRLDLARYQAASGRYEAALEHLLEIVRTDRKFRDDAGRKNMLAVFDLLGSDHELSSKYRRLLAAAIN